MDKNLAAPVAHEAPLSERALFCLCDHPFPISWRWLTWGLSLESDRICARHQVPISASDWVALHGMDILITLVGVVELSSVRRLSPLFNSWPAGFSPTWVLTP